MAKSRLISIKQFKLFTGINSDVVDQDIERGVIKTETNKSGNQNIRWFSVQKNLTAYKKDKKTWETKSQYSNAGDKDKARKPVKTKIVKLGDRLRLSAWCRESVRCLEKGIKSPQLLKKAIVDKYFEKTNMTIIDKTNTGTKKQSFVMEWLGPEKAQIITDVVYMKETVPLSFKQDYLAEKLNDSVEDEPIEEVEEIEAEDATEKATEEAPKPTYDLVEAIAQFLFGIKKRYVELVEEDKRAKDVKQEATADS